MSSLLSADATALATHLSTGIPHVLMRAAGLHPAVLLISTSADQAPFRALIAVIGGQTLRAPGRPAMAWLAVGPDAAKAVRVVAKITASLDPDAAHAWAQLREFLAIDSRCPADAHGRRAPDAFRDMQTIETALHNHARRHVPDWHAMTLTLSDGLRLTAGRDGQATTVRWEPPDTGQ